MPLRHPHFVLIQELLDDPGVVLWLRGVDLLLESREVIAGSARGDGAEHLVERLDRLLRPLERKILRRRPALGKRKLVGFLWRLYLSAYPHLLGDFDGRRAFEE